jgi:hypothetical protein
MKIEAVRSSETSIKIHQTIQLHIPENSTLQLCLNWRWVVRGKFTSGERTPGTHCIGGWVDATAGLDVVKINSCISPGLNSESTVLAHQFIRWTAQVHIPLDEGFWFCSEGSQYGFRSGYGLSCLWLLVAFDISRKIPGQNLKSGHNRLHLHPFQSIIRRFRSSSGLLRASLNKLRTTNTSLEVCWKDHKAMSNSARGI